MDFSFDEAMRVAIQAAEAAGHILCSMLETAEAREKAPKDLVTDADLAAQNAIQGLIQRAFPTHRFLGEETAAEMSEKDLLRPDEWHWVVDPLDGTVNYVHQMPNFAVSIALMRGDETILGVVFDPMACEMYAAVHGKGATVNGKPMRVSSCTRLDQALVAASFPPQVQRDWVEVDQFIEILVRSQSVRRLGSAALNLCYVGRGRLDAYWANYLKPWDIAAGALIAVESGADICRQNGQAFNPWLGELLVCSSVPLRKEIQDCFLDVEKRRKG
jgi:myo-inositol-1(or 4)-monophosphatase